MRSANFIAAVRACVGTPLQHGGRLPGVAIDCVGIPIVALASLGIEVGPTATYHVMPQIGTLETELAGYCDRLPDPAKHGPGDVLVGDISGMAHLMICVAPGRVVHAKSGSRAVVEEPLRAGHRVRSAWRIRGMEWP